MTDKDTRSGTSVKAVGTLRCIFRRYWGDFKSVYYANSPIWRVLKSGALIVLGFFCWSTANYLLSIQPGWGVLWYVMAYGFALLLWGPLTHFVVVPLVIRCRRAGDNPIARAIGRHGSKLNLTTFVLVVVVLGMFQFGPMALDFGAIASAGDGETIDPELACTRSVKTIDCRLNGTEGVGSVVVRSGGEMIATVDKSPFAFEIEIATVESASGTARLTIDVRDENGRMVRRFVRRVDSIPQVE